MTTRTHRPARRLTIGATALVAALALAACSNTEHPSAHGSGDAGHGAPATSSAPATSAPSGTSGTSAGPADAARAGDVAFAQGMIPHHEQAVEMADMALEKSSASATVRRLATQIKAAQDPEIATMRALLTAWGAPAAPTAGGDHGTGHGTGHGGHGGMMSAQDMTALAKADGAAFDRMWLTMMIEHHEGAVTMSEQVLTTTRDPQVSTLARDIISAQQAEIATMRALL